MNWLTSPWTTPRWQMTGLQELVGSLEILAVMGLLLLVVLVVGRKR